MRGEKLSDVAVRINIHESSLEILSSYSMALVS